MLQILFHIHLFGHDIPIYGFGLMLVVAFLACVKGARWLAPRVGMNPDHFVDAVLIALVTGLIGARLCHVLENFHEYTRSDLTISQNLHNIINTREGGLTFYGGFLFAIPCTIAYGLWRKANIPRGMDVAAIIIMIGLGFGRIGCFLNGCCYGAQCNLPWAVRFPYYSNAWVEQYAAGKVGLPDVLRSTTNVPLNPARPPVATTPRLQSIAAANPALPVHPTELYTAFTAFLLALLLYLFMGLRHVDGQVFALMMILEGFARYVLEMIRVEPAIATIHLHGHSYGLSISMIMGAAITIAGIAMWFLLRHLRPALL
jgi:phosphatidylglycerol:prolipoprotein diacylglycerol transferase